MIQPLILLDFDGTLFDTKSFKYQLFSEIARTARTTPEHVAETYPTLDQPYTPAAHLKALGHTDDFTLADLDIDFPNLLFADTATELEKLQPHANLALYTYGNKEFQQHKATASGIESLTASQIYTPQEKSTQVHPEAAELITAHDDIFFIDDSLAALEFHKQEFPQIRTILIDRDHEITNPSDDIDHHIHTLSELTNLVL